MKNVIPTGLVAGFLITTCDWAALASDTATPVRTGDVCLCELSELHPTQAAVGMAEVRNSGRETEAANARSI